MATIRTEQLTNGAATGKRHSGCDHEVTIWSYDTYATIYYNSGEPVACIRRPSRGDDKWRVFAPLTKPRAGYGESFGQMVDRQLEQCAANNDFVQSFTIEISEAYWVECLRNK